MESNEIPDIISYSQFKLSNLFEQENCEKTAIYKFIEEANYGKITDFLPGLEWFNVSEPLSLEKHLEGKVVVLDFFTYCCINCMHILPLLKELENEFSVEDGLVVVGVHSAKFANEKLSTNILSAVQRYNITHPVVNDRNCDLWKSCEIQCWPTLLILGPQGQQLLMLIGEGHDNQLQIFMHHAIRYFKEKNQISKHKLPYKSAYHLLPDLKGPLLFPGKITSFVKDNKEILALSDTGNHRVLIINSNGDILVEIGSRKGGFKDGNFKNCEFNSPQGLVFQNEHSLYVADTENHAIRLINLKNNIVSTVVGSGLQGTDYEGGKMGIFQEISSPWDVCIYKTDPNATENKKEVLLIAAAGTHQIWALFLDDVVWWKNKKYIAGTCVSIVGSGKEENKNNRYPHAAAFAQPSGLSISYKTKELFVADSESSSVRKVSLLDGSVSAVVGGDKNPTNLFAFGDKDGILHNAKLQHVLGVAVANDGSTLFVADSYNHKIKKVDISKNEIKSLIASHQNDALDGNEIRFNEPGGICVGLQNKIYIADTNNHSIKIVELNTDDTIKSLKNLELIAKPKQENISNILKISGKEIILNAKGGKIIANIKLQFSDNLKLNQDAPQKWTVKVPSEVFSAIPTNGSNVENFETVLNVPAKADGTVFIEFNIVTCTPSTCLPKKFALLLPVKFEQSGPLHIEQNFIINVTPDDLKIL